MRRRRRHRGLGLLRSIPSFNRARSLEGRSFVFADAQDWVDLFLTALPFAGRACTSRTHHRREVVDARLAGQRDRCRTNVSQRKRFLSLNFTMSECGARGCSHWLVRGHHKRG